MIRDKNGKWLNSDIFRQEGLKFQKNKSYIAAPFNTPDWKEYWETQLKRCEEGYAVEDEEGNIHKITNHHYFYLNFTEIEIVETGDDDDESVVAEKITQSPDFWDGDYDYFWSLEIARSGLFTKNTQVPSTPEERKTYNAL